MRNSYLKIMICFIGLVSILTGNIAYSQESPGSSSDYNEILKKVVEKAPMDITGFNLIPENLFNKQSGCPSISINFL